MANLRIFAGSSNTLLAERVAREMRVELGRANVGRFSDGEVNFEIEENVRGEDVFLLQSTCAPTNDNLMESRISVMRARTAGRAPRAARSAPRWSPTC